MILIGISVSEIPLKVTIMKGRSSVEAVSDSLTFASVPPKLRPKLIVTVH